jgi:hypothetical protein
VSRGTAARPYDAYCLFPGRFIAIETKVVPPQEYLYLLPHQIGSLRLVTTLGHTALIVVRIERDNGLTLAVRAITVAEYDDWRTTHDRQAIPWRTLPDLGADIPRLHGVLGVVWDVRPFLGPVENQQQTVK